MSDPPNEKGTSEIRGRKPSGPEISLVFKRGVSPLLKKRHNQGRRLLNTDSGEHDESKTPGGRRSGVLKENPLQNLNPRGKICRKEHRTKGSPCSVGKARKRSTPAREDLGPFTMFLIEWDRGGGHNAPT